MKPAPLPSRLPLAVLNLCWALAAAHWHKGSSGATYAGLKRMLGTTSEATLYRTVAQAKAHGVVKVVYTDKHAAGGPRPLVLLKATTLKQLEAVWRVS